MFDVWLMDGAIIRNFRNKIKLVLILTWRHFIFLNYIFVIVCRFYLLFYLKYFNKMGQVSDKMDEFCATFKQGKIRLFNFIIIVFLFIKLKCHYFEYLFIMLEFHFKEYF